MEDFQNQPLDIAESCRHDFSLVNGTFNAEEAGYLVLSLLHQKIDFLTVKSLSKKEISHGCTDVLQYLETLSSHSDIVRDMVLCANSKGKRLKIRCDVHIDVE